MSEANRGRGQPRRGYRRTKPATRSGAGRLWSRRAAGFLLHTFLSPPKEKCERPIGLQALLPRRSRRVKPAGVNTYAPAGAPKGFPPPFGNLRAPKVREKSIKQQVPIRASCGASIPRRGFSDSRLISDLHKQGAFRSPPAPLQVIVAATNSFRQKMTSLATPKGFPQNKPFQPALPLCASLFVPHSPKWPRQKRGQ